MNSDAVFIGLLLAILLIAYCFIKFAEVTHNRLMLELEQMKHRHATEKIALDNYTTATRKWLDGKGTYTDACYAYEQYLVICGYKKPGNKTTNSTDKQRKEQS